MMNLINLKLLLAIFINLNLPFEQVRGRSLPIDSFILAEDTVGAGASRQIQSVLISEECGTTYFADKLFIEGKYKSAITEYERLNFFAPTTYFKYQIGMCYWKLGELGCSSALEHAALIFKELDSLSQLVQVYIELGEYSLARFVCEDLDKNLVGWIYIVEGRWEEAAQTFDNEELRTVAFKGNELPYKSEKLATIMSIVIPGMGEIYANHWMDGILTFAFNTISAVFAIKAFKKCDYVTTGLITSFLWHRFYSGGIENAIKLVKEYNNELKKDFIEKVKKKYNYPFGHTTHRGE